MNHPESDLEALVQRLQKSERQIGRIKVAGVTVLLLAGVGLLMGQAAPTNNGTIEAQKFVLRDENGVQRAVLPPCGRSGASHQAAPSNESCSARCRQDDRDLDSD